MRHCQGPVTMTARNRSYNKLEPRPGTKGQKMGTSQSEVYDFLPVAVVGISLVKRTDV